MKSIIFFAVLFFIFGVAMTQERLHVVTKDNEEPYKVVREADTILVDSLLTVPLKELFNDSKFIEIRCERHYIYIERKEDKRIKQKNGGKER